MPDELIYCPACNHRLRLPAELLGQSVECPQCQAHFAAPPSKEQHAPQPGPPLVMEVALPYADDAEALAQRGRGRLKAPGACLLVVGALGVLVNAYVLMQGLYIEANPALFNQQIEKELDKNPQFNPQERQQIAAFLSAENIAPKLTGLGALSVTASLLTAFGGIAMLTCRMYWLALLGALAALNPIDCCCVDINIPFAIWALIVLLSADGRAAFR